MKRWPLNKAYFWETAPFFRILLPLLAGIVCYDRGWMAGVSGTGALMAAVAVFLLFLGIGAFGKGNPAYRVIAFCMMQAMMLFAGYSLSFFSDIRNDKQWFGNELGKNASYLAQINDVPVEKEHSWKVPVTIISAITDGKVARVKGNAFVYVYKDYLPMLLRKGDSILLPGRWQPIKNAGNPFEFDYARYCRQNNLYYQQSCSISSIRLYGDGDDDAAPLIGRAHDWCMSRLDKYIAEPKTKGLVQAMLLGDEVNLDEDLRQSYSDTGIVHIIAISGGNVSIFFFAISFLLWWMKNKKHRWVKYAVALPLVWFYVLMAGAPPSAIRAAIMFSLLAFSVMLQKNSNSLNTLLATAFLLLCAEPMWLFSVGFQLSFVAVLSLVLFYAPVYRWLSPVYKINRLLWGTVAASIAAEVLAAPVVIYYFHTFPLSFLIANVAGYLFMSAVLILSIAIILLGFWPLIATGIGICTVWLATVFDKLVSWLQGLSPRSFHFLVLSGPELMVAYAAIAGILLFVMKKQKPALFAGLVFAILLFASFCKDEWQRLHQERFIVYNTGKDSQAERIKGGAYTVANADTGAQKKTSYAVKPAHTYWQAWEEDSVAGGEIFYIGGKSVLVLKRSIKSAGYFPVDYLVVASPGNPEIGDLQRIFSPATIVLGNNYTLKQQDKLVRENAAANIYSVAERGAFVLN